VNTRGSIIVGLLWCLALVSLVVVGFLHSARIDLQVQKNYADRIQAHYLALAGIERAKALLYQNARDRSRTRQNHDGQLYNAPDQFRDAALGRGHFRVFRRAREDEGGGVVFGVADEESRLNVNTASTNELEQIDGMNDDVITALLAWRSGRNTAGGAEDDYYASLQPPSKPRKAPFQTIRELLMVRGVSRELLLGRDRRQNGLLEPAEAGDDFVNEQADEADQGWAGIMTVDSSVKNLDATGQDRINIQTADENTLASVPGLTPQLAHAIVTYRGQNQFQSIANLLDVTAPAQNNSSQAGTGQQSQSGQGQQANSGPRVISQDLLLDIADQLTTDSSQDLAGAININTAGISVLACLPGMDRQLAQAIVSYRQSQGFFPNIAWLLEVPGITTDLFKQLAPLITTRSETYRILSEGRVDSTSIRQRIQVIVRVGLHDAQTLSYREDDL
jgi:competence ComEA-like helix-hairpin-helix protein